MSVAWLDVHLDITLPTFLHPGCGVKKKHALSWPGDSSCLHSDGEKLKKISFGLDLNQQPRDITDCLL
jgi:hypothetical protein